MKCLFCDNQTNNTSGICDSKTHNDFSPKPMTPDKEQVKKCCVECRGQKFVSDGLGDGMGTIEKVCLDEKCLCHQDKPQIEIKPEHFKDIEFDVKVKPQKCKDCGCDNEVSDRCRGECLCHHSPPQKSLDWEKEQWYRDLLERISAKDALMLKGFINYLLSQKTQEIEEYKPVLILSCFRARNTNTLIIEFPKTDKDFEIFYKEVETKS